MLLICLMLLPPIFFIKQNMRKMKIKNKNRRRGKKEKEKEKRKQRLKLINYLYIF